MALLGLMKYVVFANNMIPYGGQRRASGWVEMGMRENSKI
jgi:hypothetical protein